jgi:hypothetical protein
MIRLYNEIDKVYQIIILTKYDVKFYDLIKYIQIHKHSKFNEINFSKKVYGDVYGDVFIKTSIILFDYFTNSQIKLEDEINKNELLIIFNYKYYYLSNNDYGYCYKEFINDIYNYENIIDAINLEPYKILFINEQYENYEEICKLAVQKNGYVLQCIENQTDEICKLAVQKYADALRHVKVQTYEICKLAVQTNCWIIEIVKEQFQTEEICKLAVQQNSYTIRFVKNQKEEICKLAVEKEYKSLQYIKEPTLKIIKIAKKRKCIRNMSKYLFEIVSIILIFFSVIIFITSLINQ